MRFKILYVGFIKPTELEAGAKLKLECICPRLFPNLLSQAVVLMTGRLTLEVLGRIDHPVSCWQGWHDGPKGNGQGGSMWYVVYSMWYVVCGFGMWYQVAFHSHTYHFKYYKVKLACSVYKVEFYTINNITIIKESSKVLFSLVLVKDEWTL